MPVCPNCGYEYVEGVKVCPDCGVELIKNSDFIPPEKWTEDDWEVVFTSNQDYEVEMLKDNLDSAGIISTILSQKDRNFPAPGDFSLIKLVVRKEDAAAAREFIENMQSGTNNTNLEE
jgi:hypothetical protein